jgi:putative transposase
MASSKDYQGFAGKLHHDTPGWVPVGSLFHIRIRSLSDELTRSEVAQKLMSSALDFHRRARWGLGLFLVMPTHVHALISFEANEQMSSIIGQWKRFNTRENSIRWQEGYFDHRLRGDSKQLDQQVEYILKNPVTKGLCKRWSDWPWVINQL